MGKLVDPVTTKSNAVIALIMYGFMATLWFCMGLVTIYQGLRRCIAFFCLSFVALFYAFKNYQLFYVNEGIMNDQGTSLNMIGTIIAAACVGLLFLDYWENIRNFYYRTKGKPGKQTVGGKPKVKMPVNPLL